MSYKWLFVLLIALLPKFSFTQTNQSSANIMMKIDKLNVLGSVLYFAAHPDDENTRLISYLASDRNYRTSYLSLTRGDGGQNLIGSELGINLGLIRTQELLAARKLDGGEQYFSSAYDFGFSKTYEETFRFWDKKEVLREAVYLIRKLRPDVIINRFPPDERGGHGHHQASAILAHEAYIAAADPKQFPEQLKTVSVWKATRIVWNTANFGGMNNTSEKQLKINIGQFNPLVGQSYGEIAALSRSQHKSQGFGSASSRGESFEYFEHVDGIPAKADLFDNINTSWSRINNTTQIQSLISKIQDEFETKAPQKSIKALVQLYDLVEKINDNYWRLQKLKEIQSLIQDCAGIWMQSSTNEVNFTPSDVITLRNDIIVRNLGINVELLSIQDQKIQQSLPQNKLSTFASTYTHPTISQPYWLIKPSSLGKFSVEEKDFGFPQNQDNPNTKFTLSIEGKSFVFEQPIQFNYVDPVRGEVHVPISITPDLTAKSSTPSVLLANGASQNIKITFTNHSKVKRNFNVKVAFDQHIQVIPNQVELNFDEKTDNITQEFQVSTKQTNNASTTLTFSESGNQIKSFQEISYDHIPKVTWFPDLSIKIQPVDIQVPVKKIGYIAGAGDRVAESMRSIGIHVDIISENQLNSEVLKQYDAIVFGIRAFNVHPSLLLRKDLFLSYVNQGGVVLMQYNVNSGFNANNLGPYPFTLSRDRVTEEDAVVNFDTKAIELNFPNKISSADFEGWIQERGLYFADNIDAAYRTPLTMHDRNESDKKGSLLITDYGKGKFVYTSLAFFRQLPAGVPGAYRLFVNLLTKENSKK